LSSQQQAQLSVVKEKTPMENFQVNRRYKTICTSVLGMIATGDGKLEPCFSTNWICLRRFFAWLFISLIFTTSSVIITSCHRTCTDVVVLDIACAGSKTTVLKETDRETKHIIETLVGFENGIETNRHGGYRNIRFGYCNVDHRTDWLKC
jgi:hypothetical protein